MKKLVFLFSLLLIGIHCVSAQDTIVKRDNSKLYCKVLEMGSDEIKYQLPGLSVTMGIDKNDAIKVIFANGTVIEIEHSLYGKGNYENQKRNVLKFDFVSPTVNYTEFSFERSLKPGRSIEFSLGIIGLGFNVVDEDDVGVAIRTGYKFIKSPDFYLKGLRYAHILKGSYIKPELTLSLYDDGNKTVSSAAIMLLFGKQWVFSDQFSVDWFTGIGYYVSNAEYFSMYAHTIGDMGETPITFCYGLRIGFLLK